MEGEMFRFTKDDIAYDYSIQSTLLDFDPELFEEQTKPILG